MSLLKRMFGGGSSAGAEPAATAEAEYKGFTIRAIPRADQSQFVLAGVIEKTIDGVLRKHHFVRADRSPDRDEISEMALAKARLMIDQQGEQILDQ